MDQGLVGRRRELTDARTALDDALAGAGSLVLVTGEAGIGKSRLIATLAARITGPTLWGTCWNDPGTPAFWPWAAVLRSCATSVGLTPADDLAPVLGTAEIVAGPAEQLRIHLFESVASYLASAGRIQPLVILLEDLHFADQASLDLLRYLAAALQAEPVAILGTHRYPDLEPGTPLMETLADLGRGARTIALYGLTETEVGQLIEETTGHAPSAQATARIRDRTGGNPLFVIEVVRLLATQQADSHDLDTPRLPLPLSVQQVIGQRLGYLTSETLRVLAQASVVGHAFAVPVLAQITDRPESGVVDALDAAVDAGLIRPLDTIGWFEFTHALVHDVLYAGLPAARRRAVHLQIAVALEALHAARLDNHLDQLADHYVLALPDADATKALDYTRRAGERALGRLAHEEAARQFGRAVDLAARVDVDESDRVELLLTLGDARLRAGDWPAAASAYEEVAASARRRNRPAELARAALGFGAGLSGFEVRLFDQHQLDLLREALDVLGDDEPELRAWVLARLSVAESFVVADQLRVDHSKEALELAREIGDSKLLAYALSSYCDAIPGPEHTVQRRQLADEMVQLGLDARDAESELLGRRFRLVALLESGDIPGVDAEIDAFARTASRLRWPLVEWYPLIWRGMRAFIEGRLDDAEALTAQAKDVGVRGGSVNAELTADYSLGPYLLLERNHLDQLYALVESFLDEPEAGPDTETWATLPLARMGRVGQARGILDRYAASGFPLQEDGSWLDKVAALSEACAETGHAEAARRLLTVAEPFAERFHTGGTGTCCGGSMNRYLGLLATCTGDWHDADGYFQRALDANRAAGATLLVAHTLRQHAGMLMARNEPGDDDRAAAMFSEANEIYQQLGLEHWITEVAPPVRDAPPPPVGEPNVFRRDGDIWVLRYGDHTTHVRHTKGLSTLARLLTQPGHEVHVFDLIGGGTRQDRVGLSGDTGEVIDTQARQTYKRRLEELDSELDALTLARDIGRAEQVQRERDALVDQLAAAYGLGGRARHGNDPAERARSTVAKRVHSAIARIGEQHPALARHLTNSVRTGLYCSYTPEQSTGWQL
ncbi:ATP-binding protein [Phytoactinopolyspora limicola]|uniref:ATP-binding protein n=1 Tax=Phytoactinopolyspora limicola TaxID=2715536 RepID=UPI00140A7D3F|nr:AAA family ATPase [Phytoactinopolyspora limicola]